MSTAPIAAADLAAMQTALAEARAAADAGEVPVGAVVMHRGEIVVRTRNAMRTTHDPTAHAEVLALREAATVLDEDGLREATLVVTLEPCAMCAGAIVLSRVARLVFGAWDDKAGMCGSVGDLVRHSRLNHRPEVQGGVLAEESSAMLREFFDQRRRR
jgi:tRNA(adenine34) deaminase